MLSLRREVCKGHSVILKSDITVPVTKAREATARSTLRYAETDLETAALQIRYMLSFKQGSYQNNTPKVKMYSVICSAVLSFHIKYKFKYEILAFLCLLPFGSESFVISLAVQECKGQNIQNHNSTSCFVWV
jgi:hypothetical protein